MAEVRRAIRGKLPPLEIAVQEYLDNTLHGMSYNAIGLRDGVHRSTIMRRIARVEELREKYPELNAYLVAHGSEEF